MKRAVVFSPVWGLCCIFLVLASSCRNSDISDDGLSDAVYLSAEVLQGPLGKGAPVTGANLTQWSVFGYPQGDRLWSDQLEGAVLPSLFYDVPVDKQSDGSWSYGTPVSWGGLAYNYYAFFGYAPKATGMYRDPENPTGNNLELVGTSSTAGVAQLNYETLADVTSQIDLLAGVRTNLLASKKVTMQLGHMLSQIRFTAWSAQAGVTPISIAVNGIQYKSVLSSKGGKAAWLSTDPAMRGFDLRGNYPVLSVKEDQPTDLSADGRSFMLLPQDLTANTTATIDIIALVGGVEVVSTPYVINENWEAGKSYTYVLKLGGSPTEELIVTDVLVTDWVVDSEEDMSTTPSTNPVNPPTASDYVEIDGLKWTKGNLVASSSTAGSNNGCKVGAPEDGGLYFQFGSLIGYKGGATANNGTGVGSNPYTGSGTEYWGGATSWSWSNEAMVWPAAMSGTPSSWPQTTSGTEHQWYFSGEGTTSGSINVTDPSKGVGDPCTYYLGDPWRLPTAAEYAVLCNNKSGSDVSYPWPEVGGSWVGSGVTGGNFSGTQLFFPASGCRDYSSGAFSSVTTAGNYWSSSILMSTYGFYLTFLSSSACPQGYNGPALGFPVRCVSEVPAPPLPINPPTASDYVEIDGVKWTKGNLVAKSSSNNGECVVGAPTDDGLYFQFGSLIGYKGGATANNGTGVGSNPYTGSGSQWWGGASSWNWSNEAMVWPTSMSGTPSSWPEATSGTEHQWFLSGDGVTSGAMNANDPTKGVGDPCKYYLGDPWRLPAEAEFAALGAAGRSDWTTNDGVNGRWFGTNPGTATSVFFPASGHRYGYLDGAFSEVTTTLFAWSSTVADPSDGLNLGFSDSYEQNGYNRSYGFPVRCVAK